MSTRERKKNRKTKERRLRNMYYSIFKKKT